MLLKKHIPVTYVVSSVLRDGVLLTLLTATVFLWQRYGRGDFFTVPLPILTILGTAISLLLAFRTNQSYERWWEARVVWGGIVNDSRSLLRQVLAFAEGRTWEKDHALVRRLARRQAAWCYCLGQSLRGQDALANLEGLLDPDELQALAHYDNKPNALLQYHARDLQALFKGGVIDSIQLTHLDGTLSRLCDHMGRCERIKTTVFLVTYSLFLRAFIYLFIFIIPLGLGSSFGASEIPFATCIGLAFFLIEKTATLMQDPFENRPTDTAMTTIATNIHRALMQMIGEPEHQPAPKPPELFYAM